MNLWENDGSGADLGVTVGTQTHQGFTNSQDISAVVPPVGVFIGREAPFQGCCGRRFTYDVFLVSASCLKVRGISGFNLPIHVPSWTMDIMDHGSSCLASTRRIFGSRSGWQRALYSRCADLFLPLRSQALSSRKSCEVMCTQ